MFHLALALLFSLFPVVIIIAVLALCASVSGSSSGSSSSSGSNSSKQTSRPAQNTGDNGNSLSFMEINQIAGRTDNDIRPISEGCHNEIQKMYRENPSITEEEVAQKLKVNVDTVRAHRPVLNMSCQEINRIAGRTDNDIRPISEGCHNEIQKMYRDNPSITEEEVAQKTKVNVETVRAHRPVLNMSWQEINQIAGRTDNKIRPISEGCHKEIQKMFRENPAITDEEVAQKTKVNVETVRAHKQR